MTTSFVIAYPDIPVRAKYTTYSASMHATHGGANWSSGPRYTYSQLASNGTTLTVDYDLGRGNNSNVTYAILARVDRFSSSGTKGGTVYYSDNGTTFTSHATLTPLASHGPRSHDYVLDITAATVTHRYWRVTLTNSSSASMMLSKLYIGDWFDMGAEPNIQGEKPRLKDSEFKAGSGATLLYRGEEQPRQLFVEWEGVSDAKVKEFTNSVVRASDQHKGLFIYTRSVVDLLDGETLLHCELSSYDTEPMHDKQNYNRVRATFRELLG